MALPRLAWLVLSVLVLAGCASPPKVPYSKSLAPWPEEKIGPMDWVDGRGRFREIFCAITEAHGRELPDYRPCEEALTRVEIEPAGTGAPVNLGPSEAGMVGLMVPGVGWECVKAWLDMDNSAPLHVAGEGFGIELVEVDGLSSSDRNSLQVAEYLSTLPERANGAPLVLLGYSKGISDVMEMLVQYPELAAEVDAVVSFAGAVRGSPLAEEYEQSTLNLLKYLPGSDCEEGDGGAMASLLPSVRNAWLENNTLPAHIRYYSVVAWPEPERVSVGLKFSWRQLGRLSDARNDSQVVFHDQIIPGSTLLAFANADHWAMAVPVARQHDFAASTYASDNDYPREVMLEALLRYVEEDLARNGEAEGEAVESPGAP